MSDSSASEKCAVVTGASSGIGEAFVHLLADEGYRLVICARNEGELNRVAGIVGSKRVADVTAIPLDLSTREAGDVLGAELAARGLSPEVVINNAGYGLTGHAAEIGLGPQVNMTDLNVRSVTDLALRFLPDMIERGRGGIINVSSIAAYLPGPGMAVYFASKAYVTSFTDALHEELRGSGVTATALCPGPVRTDFQNRSGMNRLRIVKFARMQTAEYVAQAGWDGFKRGSRVVIPGALNEFLAYASRITPRVITLPAVRFFQSPAARGK